MTPPRPILFGEALFDCFPDGKRILGGAPFNVAWHLTGLGNAPLFITRVGNDAPGMEVRRAMEDWGMDTRGVQVDPTLPTGSVRITFVHGESQYDILAHQAYDAIDDPLLPDTLRPAFLYHGSLAVRGAGQTSSRATLQTLAQKLRAPIFLDVNLRAPWWRRDDVLRWIPRAHWVKLNEHELLDLEPEAGTAAQRAWQFLRRHHLHTLIVTFGSQGALALTAAGEELRVQPDAHIPVVDTVGAGDAFTAVFLHGYLHHWPLAQTLARAQDFASAVVGVQGATIQDPAFYQHFLRCWQQEPQTSGNILP